MADIAENLKTIFGDRLKLDESMSKHTNFRIGGPAKFFVEVKTGEELKQVVELALANDVQYFILGGGSNTLVADSGFDGLILYMANRDVSIEGDSVIAQAGALSVSVARKAGGAGLTGLEWAATLPGTIGGAVRGNAGCFGGEVKDVLESVRVLRCGRPHGASPTCEIVELKNEELAFGYRTSAIKKGTDIVVDATFKLSKGNPDEIKAKMNEIMEKRKAAQPLAPGSAGCAFKNFEFESEDQLEILKRQIPDLPESFLKNKRISAGWLIDQLGFKGKQIGDIKVSTDHCNFLQNLGNGTADDVIQLISFLKMHARDELGIQLQEEIEYVGY